MAPRTRTAQLGSKVCPNSRCCVRLPSRWQFLSQIWWFSPQTLLSCPLSHLTQTMDTVPSEAAIQLQLTKSEHPPHSPFMARGLWGIPNARCSPSTERSASPGCASPSRSPYQLRSSGRSPTRPHCQHCRLPLPAKATRRKFLRCIYLF